MSVIVSSPQSAHGNILRFGSELAKSPDLQSLLAFFRSWYAYKDEKGVWSFAPSKFCGYEGMTGPEYANDEPRDGRRSEKQLQKWFTVVPDDLPLFGELNSQLTALLSKYGKPPSSAIRISVTNEYFNQYMARDGDAPNGAIADLIIAVVRGLPAEERARIKGAI